jgi:hypothetical protein
MSRAFVAPMNIRDVPVEDRGPSTKQLLNLHPETGASTFVLEMKPGYQSRNPGHLEWHTAREEILILSGAVRFGDWYTCAAPGFLMHPNRWTHPSDQSAPEGARMLIRLSQPIDMNFVPLPDGWDGQESVDGDPRPARGVSNVALNELAWEPVMYQDLTPLKYDAKTISIDHESGWTTWLMRVPAGWRGVGMRRSTPGGDELFVIDGDLTVDRGNGPVRLDSGGYSCNPDRFIDGGAGDSSETGCTAIRWTRNVHILVLPPVRYPHPAVG